MAPHPQVVQFLSMLESMGGPEMSDQTPDEARELYRALAALTPATDNPASTSDVEIEGPGGPIGARIYLPEDDGPHPVLVWYHGGGWVIGDLETADAVARALCVRAGVAVASIDYRLAPEHRFPAALDDAIAAFDWARAGGDGMFDGKRVAVAGDSAGGNLAALVAIDTRDRGVDLAHQLLVYPATDLTRTSQSHVDNAEGYLLTADSMEWFSNHYLGDTDPTNPRVSPLYADDLSGLASATVITAEYDPLRDEGEAYADAMREAGTPVEAVRYDGEIHGFFAMEGLLDDAKDAVDFAAAILADALK